MAITKSVVAVLAATIRHCACWCVSGTEEIVRASFTQAGCASSHIQCAGQRVIAGIGPICAVQQVLVAVISRAVRAAALRQVCFTEPVHHLPSSNAGAAHVSAQSTAGTCVGSSDAAGIRQVAVHASPIRHAFSRRGQRAEPAGEANVSGFGSGSVRQCEPRTSVELSWQLPGLWRMWPCLVRMVERRCTRRGRSSSRPRSHNRMRLRRWQLHLQADLADIST